MPFDIENFARTVEKLRAPDGCAWDKKQTHQTLTPYFIEETYEVIDAIQQNDFQELKEELGDVLLQVVLHAQIAKENEQFDLQDVIDHVNDKMIRRHPHVFQDPSINQDDNSLAKQWEEIKAQENSGKKKSVPPGPALFRAQKISKNAAKLGFDWETYKDAFLKVQEELDELQEALKNNDKLNIEEEMGDLLFALVNVSRHLKLNAEETLIKATKKFEQRFQFVEKAISEAKENGNKLTLKDMEEHWQNAKKRLAQI